MLTGGGGTYIYVFVSICDIRYQISNSSIGTFKVRTHTNVVFEVQSIEAVVLPVDSDLQNGEVMVNGTEKEGSCDLCFIHLKGQMLYMEEWNSMVYLSTPM